MCLRIYAAYNVRFNTVHSVHSLQPYLYVNNSILLYCKHFYFRDFILINSDKNPFHKSFYSTTIYYYYKMNKKIFQKKKSKGISYTLTFPSNRKFTLI